MDTEQLYDKRAKIYRRVVDALNAASARKHVGKLLPEDVLEDPLVLDVGAGTGMMASFIRRVRPEARITAIDISKEMLAFYHSRFPQDTLIHGDFQDSTTWKSYPDGNPVQLQSHTFHLIISAGALSEYGDAKKTLATLRQFLHSDGYLLNVGIPDNAWGKTLRKIWHFKPTDRKTFIVACRDAGFTELAAASHHKRLSPRRFFEYTVVMKAPITILFAAALLTVAPVVAHAAAFFTDKEQGMITVSDPTEDDVYAAGQQVTIEAPVRDDAFLAGQRIEVSADVGEDVYAAGQEITISSSVGDDVFAAGQSIEIEPGTHIAGDAFLAGESVNIREGTVIEGDLTTFGKKPTIESGAQVLGHTIHRQAPESGNAPRSDIGSWVYQVLTMFVVSLCVLYVVPTLYRRATSAVTSSPGRSALTGSVWLVLLLPACVILLMTVVGIPLAIALFLLTVVLYIIATGVAAAFVGTWAMQKLRGEETDNAAAWVHALIGAVIYQTVQVLPVLGSLAAFVFSVFIFGATLSAVWEIMKDPSRTTATPS